MLVFIEVLYGLNRVLDISPNDETRHSKSSLGRGGLVALAIPD